MLPVISPHKRTSSKLTGLVLATHLLLILGALCSLANAFLLHYPLCGSFEGTVLGRYLRETKRKSTFFLGGDPCFDTSQVLYSCNCGEMLSQPTALQRAGRRLLLLFLLLSLLPSLGPE